MTDNVEFHVYCIFILVTACSLLYMDDQCGNAKMCNALYRIGVYVLLFYILHHLYQEMTKRPLNQIHIVINIFLIVVVAALLTRQQYISL